MSYDSASEGSTRLNEHLRVRRPVGRPRQVSLKQILAAAEQVGLEHLTLQAVAAALNVTPPALYRHVRSKDDLISKFVIASIDRFPIDFRPNELWADWAPRFARALLKMYEAVPGLADYTIRQTQTSDDVLLRHEASIAAARRSGFDEISAFYATRAVVEFVASWVAREQRRRNLERSQGAHPDVTFRTHVLEAAAERFPNLAGSLRAVTGLGINDRFDFTIAALIDGLSRSMENRLEYTR